MHLFENQYKVFCDELTEVDILAIVGKTFPKVEIKKLEKFVQLNFAIDHRKHEFGHLGGPWEFNLRDLTRFLELITVQNLPEYQAFYLIYVSRMRTQSDRNILISIFSQIFG